MTSRITSRAGRWALYVLLFGVAVLVASMPVGILGSSNLVWGEDNQYGRVDVPGTAVLHLPAGAVRVSVAIDLPGRGNATPDLPFPSDLALTVTPVDSTTGQPTITRSDGTSSNANDTTVDTQRQAWTVHVPHAGSYRVTAQGDFDGIGINPQLWFGHGPPLPGAYVPLVALGLVVVVSVPWLLVRRARRGRTQPPGSSEPAGGLATRSRAPVPTMGEARSSGAARSPGEARPGKARPSGETGWGEARPSGEARQSGKVWSSGEPGSLGEVSGRRTRPSLDTTTADPLDRLAKLADLHDRGALTDAEFAAEKAKIIKRH